MTVRVVVVEDSPVQLAHLVDVLEAERDIAVIGQAGDPVEAVALVQRLRPDVVTMDLGLPAMAALGPSSRSWPASRPPSWCCRPG